MLLFPKPKKLVIGNNIYNKNLKTGYFGSFNSDIYRYRIENELKRVSNNIIFTNDFENASIVFEKIAKKDNYSSTNNEYYELEILKTRIVIKAYSIIGCFYGIKTLEQIFEEKNIPTLEIIDYPDLETRGIMLDISRSKVPTLKTLKELVDLFASLKLNHLELYVEGFSYEYQSFKKYLKDKNYISLKDYLELEQYANDNFIDLVPNQNGFGHMGDWLAQPEFHHLAECEDGFEIWGAFRPGATLDPTNEDSVKLVKKMYDDMLPYFKSKYFNMNLDEALELGKGKSSKYVEENGKENVYIEYFYKLYEHVKKYQKIPLMWGDVLINHLEAVDKLPKDVIFIDWGYDKNYDFETHASLLEEKHIKYMLAPGTSSWGSITGKYQDMYQSISHACIAAKKHHAAGVLTTDWGDMGHLQYLPISYPGFVLAGLLSWSNTTEEEFLRVLNKIIGNETITDVIIKLAKYNELEGSYRGYGTRLFTEIMWSEHGSRYPNPTEFFMNRMQSSLIEQNDYKAVNALLVDAKNMLEEKKNELNEEQLRIESELVNSINLLKILLDVNMKLASNGDKQFNFQQEIVSLKTYSEVHEKLWNARNIQYGYNFSNQRIIWLMNMLFQLDGKEKI